MASRYPGPMSSVRTKLRWLPWKRLSAKEYLSVSPPPLIDKKRNSKLRSNMSRKAAYKANHARQVLSSDISLHKPGENEEDLFPGLKRSFGSSIVVPKSQRYIVKDRETNYEKKQFFIKSKFVVNRCNKPDMGISCMKMSLLKPIQAASSLNNSKIKKRLKGCTTHVYVPLCQPIHIASAETAN